MCSVFLEAKVSDKSRYDAPRQKRSAVQERLRRPHVMAEMIKLSVTQSSEAQRQFLEVLEGVAGGIRDMLDEAKLINRVPLDHAAVWQRVAGKRITFVDGGMAQIASLGAEPIAVRVGSYSVVPGARGDDREQFRIEKQLVAELFDLNSVGGLYEDLFEDPSKLRDAARISLEMSAAVQCIHDGPRPEFLFLHGSLVNPVSAYGDETFPPFSSRGLEILLPPEERARTGRDATFVCVYLFLLKALESSGVNVTSVVERASASTLVSRTLLDRLASTDVSPGPSAIQDLRDKIGDFRIPDVILFHAILDEGEYLAPVAVDRNVAEKRPRHSADVIAQYPLPHVTYVGVGEFAQPLRIEFFASPPAGFAECLQLIVHSCRLMPHYAFPAGLDIVDKFAKVPNWMSRPINASMSVQLLKRALDTGDPKMIEAAKRLLCGTQRDWFFRPSATR